MLKFTIDVKDLKNVADKVLVGINRRATFYVLKRLYLNIDNEGILRIMVTDLEQYTEIICDKCRDTESGMIGIDIDDFKLITKMVGDVILEHVSEGESNKLTVKCGRKILTLPVYLNEDKLKTPELENANKILTATEQWLFETISKLNTYFPNDEGKLKELYTYNINLADKRIEVSDGLRVGMRKIPELFISSIESDVMLKNICTPILKKVLDKKSDRKVEVYCSEKYLYIVGSDFTYVQHRLKGKYLNVGNYLQTDENYSFIADKQSTIDIMKYDVNLLSTSDKKPIRLHTEGGRLFAYIHTRYECLDEIQVDNLNMQDDLFIGFDVKFIKEAFEICDTDKVKCYGDRAITPIYIEGNEYFSLVLPISMRGWSQEDMLTAIKKNRAA